MLTFHRDGNSEEDLHSDEVSNSSFSCEDVAVRFLKIGDTCRNIY